MNDNDGMTKNIQSLNERFAVCPCGNTHRHVEMVVDVSEDALANVTSYIRDHYPQWLDEVMVR